MKIPSFNFACKKLGYNPKDILPDVSNYPAHHRKAQIASAKLTIISEASRTNAPDWNDRSERKWYPVFDMEKDKNNPTGFRFDVSYCDISSTLAGGGSRLCYESEEDSNYHGQQHIGLYKDLMVLPKSRKKK